MVEAGERYLSLFSPYVAVHRQSGATAIAEGFFMQFYYRDSFINKYFRQSESALHSFGQSIVLKDKMFNASIIG